MERRTLLRAGIALPGAVLLSGAVGALDPVIARPRVTRSLASGLRVPWGIAFLPSGRALVSERDTGRVLAVRPRGGYHVAGRVSGVVSTVSQGGENGLLGLALHPDFARNRWVYAYLSTRSDNRIVRMRYDGGQLGAPHVVLSGIPRSLHHNGGGLAFGPGGLLYVSTGDADALPSTRTAPRTATHCRARCCGSPTPAASRPGTRSATGSGPTATATSRGSRSTATAGCGRPSSATTSTTSSTAS